MKTRTRNRESSKALLDYRQLEGRNLLAAFSGTNDADSITITFDGGLPVSININGIEQSNSDATLTLNTLNGNDTIEFVGQDFNVHAEVVEIPGGGGEPLGTFSTVNEGAVTTSSTGTVTFVTGDGDDSFILIGGTYNYDQIITVHAGAGNDFVDYLSGAVVAYLEDGDDQILVHNSYLGLLHRVDGGAGYDQMQWAESTRAILDYFGVNEQGEVLWGYQPNAGDPISRYRLQGLEHFVASNPDSQTNSVVPTSGDTSDESTGLNYVFDGTKATGTLDSLTQPVVLENFNYFRQGDPLGTRVRTATFSVLSNDYKLNLLRYDRVEIGFHVDAKTGNSQSILHDIFTNAATVVVSDFLNPSFLSKTMSVDLDTELDTPSYYVTTSTNSKIYLTSTNRYPTQLTLWGASVGGTRFLIEQTDFKVVLFGGIGTDYYRVGGSTNLDLDLIQNGTINIVGNGGTDYLYVNDQNSNGNFGYRVRDKWVHQTPDELGSSSRPFSGVWHTGVDRVIVNGNSQPNRFLVTPSNAFEISLNVNGVLSGDRLEFTADTPDYQLLESVNTAWFGSSDGSTPKSVRFYNISYVPFTGRTALGSRLGAEPFVSVYRADATTPAFGFDPFPGAPNFRGGVVVATGNIDDDFIPDIVVGMQHNGQSHVVVYNGRNGTRIGGFKAFDGFVGGIEVAVGNVDGDWRNEVVVSQRDGGNQVRVFSTSMAGSNLLTQQTAEFNPFPNAPAIGVRIATGDINNDGYDDVIAAAGPGWLPQVASYRVSSGTPSQLSRFLVAPVGATNWQLSVAGGNLLGSRHAEIVVSAVRIGSPDRVFAFDGGSLPTNAGATQLQPTRVSVWANRDRVISIVTRDHDLDSVADQVLASPSLDGIDAEVTILNNNLAGAGAFTATDAAFAGGINIG
ncbi:MAG: hypothetical protein R3C03_02980 [Pirellulaceae bacterium]